MKYKFACRQRGKYGHWKEEHKPDGSLKHGVPSHDKPQTENARGDAKKESTEESESRKAKLVLGFTSTVTSSTLVANSSNSVSAAFRNVGPLVDDAAPYSAIGEMELHIMSKGLIEPPLIEPKPEMFADYDTWQYGSGEHGSARKSIIGSVELLCRTDREKLVSIRHLILAGSSG